MIWHASIVNSRVQATDLVGLLVRVEVLHFERCGRGWKVFGWLEVGESNKDG
jgi:hypothetical protein